MFVKAGYGGLDEAAIIVCYVLSKSSFGTKAATLILSKVASGGLLKQIRFAFEATLKQIVKNLGPSNVSGHNKKAVKTNVRIVPNMKIIFADATSTTAMTSKFKHKKPLTF